MHGMLSAIALQPSWTCPQPQAGTGASAAASTTPTHTLAELLHKFGEVPPPPGVDRLDQADIVECCEFKLMYAAARDTTASPPLLAEEIKRYTGVAVSVLIAVARGASQ